MVCPGRGSYQCAELGYLQRHHATRRQLLDQLERVRRDNGQPSLEELDSSARYENALHGRSDNISGLIFAASYCDFHAIDRDRYQIVAVAGNSLGWYSALACGGALTAHNGMRVVNEMGKLMQTQASGGQLLYPLVDDSWRLRPDLVSWLNELSREINSMEDASLYDSILLGGMRVFAGNQAALSRLAERLPTIDSYPMRLAGHSAFHSPMMRDVAEKARSLLGPTLFERPEIPLVDGRGHSWFPYSGNPDSLWDYTLGHQLLRPYDYGRAIQNAVREFAPQRIVLTGPGNSLGSVTAQALIEIGWHGLQSKQDFLALQGSDPFILSMGIDEQRARVVS